MSLETIAWPSWPQYGQEEKEAVARVISSNQLFAAEEVAAFENEYAQYIGAKYACGLGNATQGLHLALAAVGVGAGDEVVVPAYSWISSASCTLMQNAVPVFCDLEGESLGLDPIALEAAITEQTKAIVVTHMFGYPAKIREIVEVARRHQIALVEDASHVHGATVDGQCLGTFGDISVFSLHQRKSLSVGDGGILCTDDAEIFETVRRLRSFGHHELSYNYRMTEFAAALGRAGLRKLDAHNEVRISNAKLLRDLLSDNDVLRVRDVRMGERGVYYAALLDVMVDFPDVDQRLLTLQQAGLPIRKTWSLLHKHPHFNPVLPPARGLPWENPTYQGSHKHVPYAEQVMPAAEYYCPDRILEFYVHPPAGEAEIKAAVSYLESAFRS